MYKVYVRITGGSYEEVYVNKNANIGKILAIATSVLEVEDIEIREVGNERTVLYDLHKNRTDIPCLGEAGYPTLSVNESIAILSDVKNRIFTASRQCTEGRANADVRHCAEFIANFLEIPIENVNPRISERMTQYMYELCGETGLMYATESRYLETMKIVFSLFLGMAKSPQKEG